MSGGNTASPTVTDRGVGRVITLPAPGPGFIGDGHTAIHVIDARHFGENDPFIMLADDRVDLQQGRRAGGPHPHGGFEIVTFVVEGELRDRDEGLLRAGDVLWMTAGSGVIHNEDVEPLGKVRILQLWVKLPSVSSWVAPRFAHFPYEQAPVRLESGIEARVYSGASGVVAAPSPLYLPLTMVDVRLAPNTAFAQELPASYNGFLYPLDGDLLVDGTEPRRLSVGQIGWLDSATPSSTVRFTAGADGARVMLYAGERQNVPIVTHGPFVGESRRDLQRLSQAYLDGRMPRVSSLARVPSPPQVPDAHP
jgi:redox-sensitive bicupin YhaK (pirin superfamily)